MLKLNLHSIKKHSNFLSKRLIFQGAGGGGETAPAPSESITGKEKQTEQAAINEVAPQSPSQIMGSAVARASTTQVRFKQSQQILAGLVNNDPLLNPNLNQTALPPGTQGATDTTAK